MIIFSTAECLFILAGNAFILLGDRNACVLRTCLDLLPKSERRLFLGIESATPIDHDFDALQAILTPRTYATFST